MNSLYIAIFNFCKRFLKPIIGKVPENKMIFNCGNWYGNDIAWRMVSDLMKTILYVDKKGMLRNNPQRKVFSIIDGIIGGENNGPLTPDEKKGGIVISGFNLLAVDIVGARLMGFDW